MGGRFSANVWPTEKCRYVAPAVASADAALLWRVAVRQAVGGSICAQDRSAPSPCLLVDEQAADVQGNGTAMVQKGSA